MRKLCIFRFVRKRENKSLIDVRQLAISEIISEGQESRDIVHKLGQLRLLDLEYVGHILSCQVYGVKVLPSQSLILKTMVGESPGIELVKTSVGCCPLL